MHRKNAKYESIPEHYVQKHTKPEASMHFPGLSWRLKDKAMRKTAFVFISESWNLSWVTCAGSNTRKDMMPFTWQDMLHSSYIVTWLSVTTTEESNNIMSCGSGHIEFVHVLLAETQCDRCHTIHWDNNCFVYTELAHTTLVSVMVARRDIGGIYLRSMLPRSTTTK